jgi:DNA-binding FrmR family transcriptional regulator
LGGSVKTIEQRINNVIGQLNAINRMTQEGQDCFQVLTQMKAAKSGLVNIMTMFLEEKARDCGTDREKFSRIIKELVK